MPGPIKTHLFPDQARTYFQNTGFLSLFEAEYEALMDRIFYLGPLREHPQREYHWSGARPTDVGPHAGNAPSMPLLRRFQRRVAEGSMSSSDLKLYFVNTKRGAAELNDLNLNEWGEIENWPDGFFGDEMGEIAAISKASLERQIQA